ncbi:tetrapyrrole biosynthesis, uroporphyrinogen III synthase [Aspergillus egyptiacus]|nr:tetrapyrrole biosynthesis, uroporphyrinogen III synthase [Aspergillus egyptiacus]
MTKQPRSILLLKTKSSPADGYAEFFSATGYTPTFVPVLAHNFHSANLENIKSLFLSGALNPGPERRYGGLIFTSQRAVEAFADCLAGIDQSITIPASQDLPLYTVGPATARSLTTLRDKHLPHASIHGAEAGNGENLARYILEHYNSHIGAAVHSASGPGSGSGSGSKCQGGKKQPLLFLVGEQRRDVIPRMLMGESTPAERRIGVEELVVYETGVVGGFEGEFERVLGRALADGDGGGDSDGGAVVWVVVFSPTGCDAMMRVLRRGVNKNERGEGNGGRRVFVATIGPTTRDHLVKECGFHPDVCAARPSPEGVGEGIGEFMENLARRGD